MNKLKERIKKYNVVSTNLACLSNEYLMHAMADAKAMHEGIGGKSSLIQIDEIPVFIKKIPITDMERLPLHFMSTANIFNLPLHYQYGVGSAGFGVWRELVTHIMTTNWVIADVCTNFPIMYHWRILPSSPSDLNIDYWGSVDNYSEYWENSAAIRKRIEDINNASFHLALFLEYIPHNVHDWLGSQLVQGDESAHSAVVLVSKSLRQTNKVMSRNGLIHFDAHFRNILTDGEQIYLSDFGLALSSKFELTPLEIEHFSSHKHYDDACSVVNLLHCIVSAFFAGEQWIEYLQKIVSGEINTLTPALVRIIKHYAPLALVMDTFFQDLQKKSKSTPYPVMLIDHLINTL